MCWVDWLANGRELCGRAFYLTNEVANLGLLAASAILRYASFLLGCWLGVDRRYGIEWFFSHRKNLLYNVLFSFWVLAIEFFQGFLDSSNFGPCGAQISQETIIDSGPRPLIQPIESADQAWLLWGARLLLRL